MLIRGSTLKVHNLWIVLLIYVFLQEYLVAPLVVPSSNCYVFDNTSHIYDFTSWIGHPFEYDGKDSDTVLRFCKDVESRSQTGYVDFGRFDSFNNFVAGSGDVNFVQGFYNGDLTSCEQSYDKLGRTAQVNIVCGNCLTGACKGELGCVCNVTYDSTCRVIVELAIPCEKQRGPRIFEGFTVGFHPRSWEVVSNGMTQLGFEKIHHEFSFGTEQTRVSLYMTAISSVSSLVGKPVLKVYPENGLDVKLSGSGTNGSPPTTLSPTMLNLDLMCEKARATPYEVSISIPVKGHEPIDFTLTKICDYRQDRKENATRGWATFGIFSCIFIVMLTLICCGGFIYKARVEHQHGLDALPGMTILSACLEAVTGGGGGGYSRVEDLNSTFINQASWERRPVSAQGSQGTSDRKYGAI
ncbi:G-protein coupled receptor [Thalictrum thalictroides]|uniref:G-protein coupled receptor n=1 Tax=Thalictrum thalictroides TaxID=46969 RepID=A0A7J6VGB0_THATH|nr:G-protein coupled receptor [Thalictrum thalictroides]